MPAYPSKADIASLPPYVRFVLDWDLMRRSTQPLVDDLIGNGEHAGRNYQVKRQPLGARASFARFACQL